jgi:hypothetical protein
MMNPFILNEMARIHREEYLKAAENARRSAMAQKSRPAPASRWLAVVLSFGTLLVVAIRLIGL